MAAMGRMKPERDSESSKQEYSDERSDSKKSGNDPSF